MGRPGLTKNRKFPRLVKALQPACGVFAEQVARGALELLWDTAYENGTDFIGEASDVEDATRWKGEPGVLCTALLNCGGGAGPGFIEAMQNMTGYYQVHDLYDHAPRYVQRRLEREVQRIKRGRSISELRSEAAKKRWNAHGCKREPLASISIASDANGMQTDANVPTPAPSPSPSPSPVSGASVPVQVEPRPVEPTREKHDWPWALLEQVRAVCGKTGLEKEWLAFGARTAGEPREKRIAGAKAFLAGGYAQTTDNPLSYCAAMIAKSSGKEPGARKGAALLDVSENFGSAGRQDL